VNVLLAADQVELYRPGDLDAHGWRETDTEARAYWSGLGNLQLGPAPSDPRAAGGGGRGPAEPRTAETGALFLPAAAEPVEGSAARIRGRVYLLSQVHLVADPTDLGGYLTCYAATATAAPDG
jgi:hypothetical protein